jgi:hypothetical protein
MSRDGSSCADRAISADHDSAEDRSGAGQPDLFSTGNRGRIYLELEQSQFKGDKQ